MHSSELFLSRKISELQNWLAQRKAWHLAFLALVVRFALYVYTIFHPELRSFADSNHYYLLGLNLFNHGGFTMFFEEGLLESIRLPGYPVLMVYLGELLSYELMLLLQCVASAAKVFFVMTIASHLGLKTFWRVMAALLVALNPTDIFLSVMYLSETFFTFFLYLGVVLILRSNQWWGWLLAGLAIGIAALTRGQGMWVMLVLLGLVVTINWKKSGWYFLGFLLLIGPWVLRNHQVFDRWFYTDAATVVTLFYTLPEVKENAGLGPADAHFSEYVDWNYQYDWSDPDQINRYMKNARNEIYSVFSEYPGTTVFVVAKKYIFNLLSPARGLAAHFLGNSPLYWLSFFLSAGLSLAFALGFLGGSIRLFFGAHSLHWVLLAIVVIVIGSSAFSAIDGRFRNPADLSLAVLLFYSLQQIFSKWAKRIRPFDS